MQNQTTTSVDKLTYSSLRGIASATVLTVLAAATVGLVPASMLVSGLVGTLIMTAWVTGAVAFACSLYAPRVEIAHAVEYHDQQAAVRAVQNAAQSRKAA